MTNWKTWDPWDDTLDLEPFDIEGCRLVLSCPAFPEAYDCYLGEHHIGYLRIRYGHFYAVYPDFGGERVYDKTLDDSYGFFTPEERQHHLPAAVKALIKKHEEHNGVSP